MQQFKDYAGTVYGGLGQLLYHYSHTNGLHISDQLYAVQNLERFDFHLWRDILDDLKQQVKSPALGLEIAQYVQPRHLGIIAYIAQTCDSLGEAITRCHDFHRLIYDGSPLKVTVQECILAIGWEVIPYLTTQVTDEIALSLLVQFMRLYLKLEDFPIERIHFREPAPKNIRFYQDYFKTQIKFSQPRVEILISMQVLAEPLKNPDPTLQNLLIQQAQALLNCLPKTTQLDHRLQTEILKGLQKNQCLIEDIAENVNLSVRQLQRHLQQQNTTFQKRMQEIRLILAQQYLQDCHLSLQEIALLLGYSEQSAFQRAFKIWVGCTPQQWRKAIR